MRALLYIILTAAMCAALAGCVVFSFTPYYTDDAVIEYPEAEGYWKLVRIGTDEEDKSIGSLWQFFEDDVEISLEITDTEAQGGRSSILHSTFFRAGDTVFMDTTARSLDEQKEPNLSNWWAMHTLPLHLLSKVTVEGDTLTITPISYEWLKEQMKAGEVELSYIVVEGLELFYATPAEWMEFLRKNHTTEELYAYDMSYVLKRGEAPAEPAEAEVNPEGEETPGDKSCD